MKKSIKILAVLFLFTSIYYSCSKDSSTSSCKFEKATFQAKTFKLVVKKVENQNQDVTNLALAYYTSDPCTQNSFVLNTDNTVKIIADPKCTQSGNAGTWDISTSNGKNIFTLDGIPFEISSFDCNSMTIVQEDTIPQTGLVKATMVFTKQ